MKLSQLALVLEGGGMRGAFTAGVIDYFLENKIYFPYVIGVSAGASNGISYASRQQGRARFGDIDLLKIRPYIGLKHMLKGNGYIDLDYIFYEYPDSLYPYDFKTYKESKAEFVMVTTDSITGKACYLKEKQVEKRLVDICRASCSLPFMCPMGEVDGIPMVDGGVSDPLPVEHAIEAGYKSQIIVLTRNKGYRKDEKQIHIPSFIYKKYPNLKASLKIRARRYNETLDLIERLEESGIVKVIRPVRKLEVGRVEKDLNKLTDLYKQGFEEASRVMGGVNIDTIQYF